MATLRNMKGSYYARLRWWVNNFQKEMQIPLRTSDKATAITRRIVVEKYEDDIVKGIIQKFQFNQLFRWLNIIGTTALVKRSIQDVVDGYLKYRKCVVRKSTAERDGRAIKLLVNFFGKPKAIEEITYKDIEVGLISYLRNKGNTDAGINITLRHIKIFFNWLHHKEKLIPEPIKFKMIKTGKQLPRYFNEREIKAIHDLKDLDSFYKDCFYFLEMTGCRPKEGYLGEIMGDWLIIDSQFTKGKNVRQIPLNDQLKAILMQMHQLRDSYIEDKHSFEKACDLCYDRMARALLRTLKKLDFKGKKLSLKSFRHTYAVKRITVTGNIYQVMREMGHTQVTTTQLYLEFPEQRRLDDFPSLRKYIEKDMVVNGSNFSHMATSDRVYANPPIQGSS